MLGRPRVGARSVAVVVKPLFKLFKQSSPRYFLCFGTASGSWHVVMVSILSVGGYFVRANGGCQTPCLVISACAVAETALASTPPPGHVAATLPRGGAGLR